MPHSNTNHPCNGGGALGPGLMTALRPNTTRTETDPVTRSDLGSI
jgi:hypothetical protein